MQAYLAIEKHGKTSRFALDPEKKTLIGRMEGCTLVFQDSKISGRHCCIETFGDYFFVIDLNSTNGTYVNNSRIRTRQLYNDDLIRIGDINLCFQWDSSDEEESDITWADVDSDVKKPKQGIENLIGNYRILKKIGEGGIGQVYKAETIADPHTIVAIKILSHKANARETLVERFIREAKALIALEHPRIIKVFELDEFQGRPYFSMEYIAGQPLNSFISKQGPIHYRNALKITGHIAHALEYAHQNHIIHRDLKPANIIIEERTHQVKLIDLGLAKMLEESDLTVTRHIIGTPRYMAPEQMRDSRTVDPRADVYSLGATLYHMLTGVPPYADMITDKKTALLKYIYSNPPIPLEEFVDVPEIITKIVEKSMAKDRNKRFANAQNMFNTIYHTLSKLGKSSVVKDK